MRPSLVAHYVLVLLAVYANTQNSFTYSFSSLPNSAFQIPSYPLGQLTYGTTLEVQINLVDHLGGIDTSSSSILITIRDSTNTNQITTLPGCNAGSVECLSTWFVSETDYYYLQVATVNSIDSYYLIRYQLSVSVGSQSLLRVSDILRHNIIKYIYVNATEDITVTLYPVNNPSISYITLYQMGTGGPSPSFTIGSSVSSVSLTATGSVSNYVYSLTNGYYAILVNQDSQSEVQITYQSDSYNCLYDSDFADYYADFQPCTNLAPSQPGLPCSAYDYINLVCTACINGYTLIMNRCIQTTGCQPRQYQHFGVCYDVNASCNTFDYNTGYCTSCLDPTDSLVNGVCIPTNNVIVCQTRQWQDSNGCHNVSSTCDTFNSSNGYCLTCILNYYLDGSNCVPNPINCPNGTYLLKNYCYPNPSGCLIFNSAQNQCTQCIFGYFLQSSSCQKIICASGFVPASTGIGCVSVSPLCATYDSNGNCLSCTLANYQVSSLGTCVQVTTPTPSCQTLQQLGFGSCLLYTANCMIYNLQGNNCQECLDGYYLNGQGGCSTSRLLMLTKRDCEDRCMDLPSKCLQVDQNGQCMLCINGDYKIVSGQCINCAPNAYPNSDCIE